MRIRWHRLLQRHQRLIRFWMLAGFGIAGAWLLNGGGPDWLDLGWLRGNAVASQCCVNSISDGDTLRATCAGEQVKIRLHCIDAPELGQRPWGQESRAYLRSITPRVVDLRIHSTDRYGRKVAEVLDPATGEALNRAMVAAGHAAVYRRYCSDPSYTQAERAAERAALGIWSTPGLHQRPWAYRQP
jgi:endonuclease YncB( thermonuclease family)